jgi:DNA-binding CsgD family transcriptional regulator
MIFQITETSRRASSVGDLNPDGLAMDLAPLVRAVEVLMSPLEWGSRDAWLAESLRRVRDACGAAGPELPANAVGELEALLHLPGDEPGWLHTAFESLDAERWDGGALPAIADGSEVFVLVVSLRCALVAGLATLHRLVTWRSTLGQAFDDVETGMAIFRADRLAEAARNARLDELLQEEPARDRLLELIVRQASRAASTENLREDACEVEVVGGIYRLIASRAAAGTLLPEAAVLVLVDHLSPGLPTTQELRITFGLRGREPQIALLAAEGLSNAAIAQRLRLSAHTVRHYLERVLERLGLHTRKALALHLMAGERDSRRTPLDGRPRLVP